MDSESRLLISKCLVSKLPVGGVEEPSLPPRRPVSASVGIARSGWIRFSSDSGIERERPPPAQYEFGTLACDKSADLSACAACTFNYDKASELRTSADGFHRVECDLERGH